MPFHQDDEIRYLTFDSLDVEKIKHAIFTRRSGVSPEPWDSLNFGSTVGDDIKNVAVNKRRAFISLGLDDQLTYDVWQVHSRDVVVAEHPRLPNVKHQKADIILSDKPGLVLLMRFADCVPLLLYDPIHDAIGIAHAGWQGTVKGVADVAVRAMCTSYHTAPSDLIAAIGPSIGPDHYQIGQEVAQQVITYYGQDASAILTTKNGQMYFDLWEANRLQLEYAGVKSIECSRICTACHLEDWYSHRGQCGKAGRFGALICLRS